MRRSQVGRLSVVKIGSIKFVKLERRDFTLCAGESSCNDVMYHAHIVGGMGSYYISTTLVTIGDYLDIYGSDPMGRHKVVAMYEKDRQ